MQSGGLQYSVYLSSSSVFHWALSYGPPSQSSTVDRFSSSEHMPFSQLSNVCRRSKFHCITHRYAFLAVNLCFASDQRWWLSIADIFPRTNGGLGMSILASAPFLGSYIGPIVGGFCRPEQSVGAGLKVSWHLHGLPLDIRGLFILRPMLQSSYPAGQRHLPSERQRSMSLPSNEAKAKSTPAAAFEKALSRPGLSSSWTYRSAH